MVDAEDDGLVGVLPGGRPRWEARASHPFYRLRLAGPSLEVKDGRCIPSPIGDVHIRPGQFRRGCGDRGDADRPAAHVDRVLPLVVLTSPGKRPWTLLVAEQVGVGLYRAESLIATTSTSVRPDSMMARRTLRPIRPQPPLIATLTAME